MIFIDPCAWQIGYKLGNILPGKWNTLDCRSTLGGVLNSHGHCDILFVSIKTSVIVCVFVWCNCNLQVILGSFMEIFWHHNTSGYWVPLLWVRGKDDCPLGSQDHPAKPMITLSTALSASKRKYLQVNTLVHQLSSGLNLDHALFQQHHSNHHKNKQTNQRNCLPHPKSSKTPKKLPCIVNVDIPLQRKSQRNKFC